MNNSDEYSVQQDDESGLMIMLNRKSRPGRPRGGIQPQQLAIVGAFNKPTNPDFRCEILFARNLVKTIVQVTHALVKQQLTNLIFRFEVNGLYILHRVRDDSRQVYPPIINIFFNASSIHYYFCKEPTKICINIQQLKAALEFRTTTTTYIHMIVPQIPTVGMRNFQQVGELYNGTMKVRVHSPSNSLSTYCERVLQSISGENITEDGVLIYDHYQLEFWLSNKHLKSIVNRQKDGYISIQKVGNGHIVVQINSGSQPSEFSIREDSVNVIHKNLEPQQVIYSSTRLHSISELIHTIDPPSDRLYIKTHTTEPPILAYRIMNADLPEGAPACYIDLRIPLYSPIM